LEAEKKLKDAEQWDIQDAVTNLRQMLYEYLGQNSIDAAFITCIRTLHMILTNIVQVRDRHGPRPTTKERLLRTSGTFRRAVPKNSRVERADAA